MATQFETEVLQPLRGLADDLIDTFTELGEHQNWSWKPGARVEHEVTNFRWGDRPQGESPLRWGYHASLYRMHAAADHLGALARTLQWPPKLFGPVVVARASLEAAARVQWLCAPDVSLPQRFARHAIERLEGLDWWADRASDAPGSEDREARRELFEELLADVYQVEVRRSRRGRLIEVGGERTPTWTRLVSELLEGPGNPGRSVYQRFAAVAHGEVFALGEFLHRSAPDTPDLPSGQEAFGLDARQVRLTVGVAVAGTGRAMLQFSDAYGWKSNRPRRAIEGILWEAACQLSA